MASMIEESHRLTARETVLLIRFTSTITADAEP
jgi:hypothetical protein